MGSKIDYATDSVVSISLAGLANNSYAVSSAIDNSATKLVSADIVLYFKTAIVSGTDPLVALFILRSVDGGIVYDDINDFAETLRVFPANTSNTTFTYSVDTSTAIGMLPEFFKLAIKNSTGSALDASALNHEVRFRGKRLLTINHFV